MSTGLAELDSLAARLISSWHDYRPDPMVVGRKVRRWAAVGAAASHSYRLAEAFMQLHAEGQDLEAAPLSRACFESALMAQWIAQVDDADLALIEEDARQRKRLIDTMVKAKWISESGQAGKFRADITADATARSKARSIEAICQDLVGGDSAYVIYRGMSWFAHPSSMVIDYYIEPEDDMRNAVLRRSPRRLSTDERAGLLMAVCIGMVWGGRAVDFQDRSHARRSLLRSAAKQLGVPDHMKLSASAAMRTSRAGPRRRDGSPRR